MNFNFRSKNSRKRCTKQRNNTCLIQENNQQKQRKLNDQQYLVFAGDNLGNNKQQRKKIHKPTKSKNRKKRKRQTKIDKILSFDENKQDDLITLDYLLCTLKNDLEQDSFEYESSEEYGLGYLGKETKVTEKEKMIDNNPIFNENSSEEQDLFEEEEFSRIKKLKSKVGELTTQIQELNSKTQNSVTENKNLNKELDAILKFLSNTEEIGEHDPHNLICFDQNSFKCHQPSKVNIEIERKNYFDHNLTKPSFSVVPRTTNLKTSLCTNHVEKKQLLDRNQISKNTEIQFVYISRND
ncbi:hypothetical protein M0812_10214 [Anaeramoeba flamelloides]|uniref:Uncharacterized protein n=1 Tax=Anaeramoeba flamelloides TaxID=1746091 RepID=A0AAV7ZQU7_9EUKA|nr:hypothetical protein M0812_10214 [Anaeramoeba flamelloides]